MAETLTKGISTSKNPELQKQIVEKLLNDERVAPDGYKLGTLANNRTYAARSVQLLDNADKELRQANRQTAFDSHSSWTEKADQGLISQSEYEKLVDEHQSHAGRFTDDQVIGLKHRSDAVLEKRRAGSVCPRREAARPPVGRRSASGCHQRRNTLAAAGQPVGRS
jgi:hypothetical protein